jgi:UDP-N-acetylglucosamine 4,6-dehydratase
MNWNDLTVLITGGTGSFGTAFSRFLLNERLRKLIIFSRCWLKQKNLRDELGDPPFCRWFIGDVRDKDRLVRALNGVDIVIHAAAIKDLPTCEYNPSEAMLTNVQGTQNLIDACIEQRVRKAILISTDKAVNPINTYGKTKALAESLWLNANKYAADDSMRFSVCRYGNVVASAGSVVPVFKKLIEQGVTELPITDERMTRFWMPMQDAVKFVADSIERMRGGELFIPKLPSIRIVDLCAAFGLPYKVVGIRAGEKLHEELEPGYDSGSNPHFLSVDQIKQTIGAM